MQGYLDDPEATAAAIDERGFLHTGDLATMDDRGYVRIVGRLKDMLIVGGFNVYPAEVENTLLAHDAIGQVAVIGVPDERMGEVAMAYVVPAAGTIGRPRRDHRLGPRTPRQLQGAATRGRDRGLPINAAGKVVKDELRARAASAKSGALMEFSRSSGPRGDP